MTSAMSPASVDFVTFACRKDVHYAKALLGSIRHYYPEHQIHVVLDDVTTHDERQLARFPGVVVHRVGSLVEEHGLPLRGLLAKLNVLFLPGITRAMVADADSVLVGRVLDAVRDDCHVHFLNAQTHDRSNQRHVETFDRWAIDLSELNRREGRSLSERFVFAQGSHFFIDVARFPAPVLRRMLPDMSLVHTPSHMLRAGDQGFWNYLANFGNEFGIVTHHSPATIQVGVAPHIASYDDAAYFAEVEHKQYWFLHYVGGSRTYLRRSHEYAAALQWATGLYYKRFGKAAFVRDEIARLRATLDRGIKLGWKRCWEAWR
jgi:hypothetical protein